MVKSIFVLLAGLILLGGLSSCYTTKNTVYFKNLSDSVKVTDVPSAVFVEPVIQPDDILNITIQTIDPQASSSVNQGNIISSTGTSTATGPNIQGISGFLVDKEGYVELPLIGKLRVGGLTTFQARDEIRKKALTEYNNPTIQVRFANYKITVIGEVTKPATYTVPNEKVSVLDALGLAGDLTIFGKRENILLIRDHGEKKEMVRLNLNSSDLLSSPYFYLKQNDVLYVEPNKAKVATNNAARTQTYAIFGSVLSVLIVLLTRLK